MTVPQSKPSTSFQYFTKKLKSGKKESNDDDVVATLADKGCGCKWGGLAAVIAGPWQPKGRE